MMRNLGVGWNGLEREWIITTKIRDMGTTWGYKRSWYFFLSQREGKEEENISKSLLKKKKKGIEISFNVLWQSWGFPEVLEK